MRDGPRRRALFAAGVFETMPLKGEFNGSLWTLPIEFRLYLYLAAGWFVFALLPAIRVRALPCSRRSPRWCFWA